MKKPAARPVFLCAGFDDHRRSNVGAGLLAKAVCQAVNVLTDLPSSRASPLPHFDLCSTQDLRLSGCAANVTPAKPCAINARILPWSLPSGVATTER
ncbi:hypothetical protein FPT15_21100 [Pseudomonas sp. RGB]|nr:hypothetical protein FPT15_21100 [Pseudomonas sp. RGB]